MTSEFDVRLGFSYSIGCYLAINALPDALLVMDGKDCVMQKVSQIQGNHDLCSTLFASDGAHRIITTHAMPEDVWRGRQEDIDRCLNYAVARADINVIFQGAMRMASITDPQYEMLLLSFAEKSATDKPLIALPTRTMKEDWLAGYADTLTGLAKVLKLAKKTENVGRPRVGIVGYMMDRNEDDHKANHEELASLIAGLGADLVSTWLCGLPSNHLAQVGEADLIVSLPYARKAAAILADRTGATLLETDLPMGLEGTTRWVRQLGDALGHELEAEALIGRELEKAVPKLQWMVPLLLSDLTIGMVADPYLLRAFLGMVREFGIQVPLRGVWSSPRDDISDLSETSIEDPVVIVDPREGELGPVYERFVRERQLKLLVGNSYALADVKPKVAAFEFGFPSFHSHALSPQPFFGYRGCLSILGRLAERLKMHELLGHVDGALGGVR